MKQSIREALESTTPAQERTSAQRYRGMSSLATQHEVTLHRDALLRFLEEASNNGDSEMTISDLIMHLKDYP